MSKANVCLARRQSVSCNTLIKHNKHVNPGLHRCSRHRWQAGRVLAALHDDDGDDDGDDPVPGRGGSEDASGSVLTLRSICWCRNKPAHAQVNRCALSGC